MNAVYKEMAGINKHGETNLTPEMYVKRATVYRFQSSRRPEKIAVFPPPDKRLNEVGTGPRIFHSLQLNRHYMTWAFDRRSLRNRACANIFQQSSSCWWSYPGNRKRLFTRRGINIRCCALGESAVPMCSHSLPLKTWKLQVPRINQEHGRASLSRSPEKAEIRYFVSGKD